MNELLLKGMTKPFFYLDVCNGLCEEFKNKAMPVFTTITKDKVSATITANHKRLGVTIIEGGIMFVAAIGFARDFRANSSDKFIAEVLESVDDFLGVGNANL